MDTSACTLADCGRKHKAHGLCDYHYRKQRRQSAVCSYGPCTLNHIAKGLCSRHLRLHNAGKPLDTKLQSGPYAEREIRLCSFEGCGRKHMALGYCRQHHRRHQLGRPMEAPIGDRTAPQRVRRRILKTGYVVLYLRPTDRMYDVLPHTILEHRYIMSVVLGRPLTRGENVHHKNGQRGDNHRRNLELWSTSQPAGQRVEDKLAWAHKFIAQYEGYELAS